MATYAILESTLTDLADIIRVKAKITGQLSPAEMINAVASIHEHTNEDLDGMIMRTSEIIESNTAEYVANYAFYSNQSVRVVVLPNVTSVGEYAFHNCHNLEHVSCGAGWIGAYAFFGCDELIEFLFSDDLGAIQVGSFNGCSSLTTVNLRNTSVSRIEPSAFANSGINELWLPENTYCALTNAGSFSGTPLSADGTGGTIYVPLKFRVRYESNAIWASVFGTGKNRVVTY